MRVHFLHRVSGELKGFGSLDFALAFGGTESEGDVDERISMSSGSLSLDLEDVETWLLERS